jgi:23S rRNA-/tRNA-specific pseudouridylate synthase
MTQLCFLEEGGSVENALKELNLSHSQIKKSGLSHKFLNKKIDGSKNISLPINLLNWGMINPLYEGPEIEIISEDDLVLALNKPPGIHCYPLKYDDQKNIMSYLREHLYLKKTEFCFDRDAEGGLLYRLDLETSGVLLMTKRKKILEEFRQDFKRIMKTKVYLCIVQGEFLKSGLHEHALTATGPKKGKVKVVGNGDLGIGVMKTELLQYSPVEDLSLVKVEIFTGIRHQIRSQLSFLGHPILGDILYGGAKGDRLFLHALRYGFHLAGKKYEFIAKKAPLFANFFDLNRIF